MERFERLREPKVFEKFVASSENIMSEVCRGRAMTRLVAVGIQGARVASAQAICKMSS
jgi:hypothetical protein